MQGIQPKNNNKGKAQMFVIFLLSSLCPYLLYQFYLAKYLPRDKCANVKKKFGFEWVQTKRSNNFVEPDKNIHKFQYFLVPVFQAGWQRGMTLSTPPASSRQATPGEHAGLALWNKELGILVGRDHSSSNAQKYPITSELYLFPISQQSY